MNALGPARSIGYAERAAFYATETKGDQDLTFLRGLVGPDVRAVLEVPSGSGRDVPWLAGTRRDVVLVDMEPRMVEQTRAAILKHNAMGRMRAQIADVRYLRLERAFDLILVPRESLQLLARADLPRALRALRAHLAPAGVLLLDLARFCRRLMDGNGTPSYYSSRVPDGALVDEWERSLGDGTLLSRSRRQVHGEHELAIDFFYKRSRGGELVDRMRCRVVLQRYERTDLVGALEEAGLRELAVFGEYDRRPACDTTGRLIFLLERRISR